MWFLNTINRSDTKIVKERQAQNKENQKFACEAIGSSCMPLKQLVVNWYFTSCMCKHLSATSSLMNNESGEQYRLDSIEWEKGVYLFLCAHVLYWLPVVIYGAMLVNFHSLYVQDHNLEPLPRDIIA